MINSRDLSFRSSIILILLLAGSCSRNGGFAKREAVEKAHGLRLPASSSNFQQIAAGHFFDHGTVSLFELAENDVPEFVAQLTIRSRNRPVKTGFGEPC